MNYYEAKAGILALATSVASATQKARANALIFIFRLITKQKAEYKPVTGREARLGRLPLTEFVSALKCLSEKGICIRYIELLKSS